MRRSAVVAIVGLVACLSLAESAFAGIIIEISDTENAPGDFSDTPWGVNHGSLDVGVNTISGTVSGITNGDYFQVELLDGFQIVNWMLEITSFSFGGGSSHASGTYSSADPNLNTGPGGAHLILISGISSASSSQIFATPGFYGAGLFTPYSVTDEEAMAFGGSMAYTVKYTVEAVPTAVPDESATLLLLGISAVGLVTMRRRFETV